jgi:hypothetical protein
VALRAYRGPANAAEANALANEIDAALNPPGAESRLSAARVDGWI